mgnify:CR=1 FL=1
MIGPAVSTLCITLCTDMLTRLQPDQVCHDLPISKHGQFQIVPHRKIGQLLGSRHRVIPIRAAAGTGATARSGLPLQLAYNVGRIASYTVAGALAGGIGSAAWLARHLLPIQQGAFVAANLVMVALGIALTGLAGGVEGRPLGNTVTPPAEVVRWNGHRCILLTHDVENPTAAPSSR